MVRLRRQDHARAIDQHGRNAGAAAEIAHDLRHPVEIYAGNDDCILLAIDRRYRIGGHHVRSLAGFGEQKVAENEAAGCNIVSTEEMTSRWVSALCCARSANS